MSYCMHLVKWTAKGFDSKIKGCFAKPKKIIGKLFHKAHLGEYYYNTAVICSIDDAKHFGTNKTIKSIRCIISFPQ